MTFVYFCFKFPVLTPADMEVVDTNPGKEKKTPHSVSPILNGHLVYCYTKKLFNVLVHRTRSSSENDQFRNSKGLSEVK